MIVRVCKYLFRLVGISYRLEKQLFANPYWGKLNDMVERGALREATADELECWATEGGHHHYLPVLAVKQPHKTTPVTIVFDAARKGANRICINDCIHKGTDNYLNSLLAVSIGFRLGRVAAMMDIIKFHWRVRLNLEDCHM